jgi:hypothetical protein
VRVDDSDEQPGDQARVVFTNGFAVKLPDISIT